MKKKFCRDLLSLAAVGLLFLQMSAQQPLKIGATVPESVWESPLQLINASQQTTTLSKDRDKLILLDFWATWCSGCLKNFPKMEALEQQFGDHLKIVPVTKESRATLEKFFATKNGQRFKHIASVAEDELLSKVFPYHAIPFIVWIQNGQVINTTDAEQVTAKTIGEILQQKTSSLQTVLQINRKRPLMLAEQFELEKSTHLRHYALLSKGRIRAIPPGSGFHRTDEGVVYGRQMTNVSLMNVFRAIGYELFREQGDLFSEKRITNLVKDPAQIDFTIAQEDDPVDALLYNFEFIVPLQEADSLYSQMLKSLSAHSGYVATIEMQRKKCLVLKRISNTDAIATQGGISTDSFFKNPSFLHNQSLETLIAALNVNSQFTVLPVVDETDYKGKVDLNLGTLSDLASLKKALHRHGLDLVEGDRMIRMLVVKDR